MTTAGWLVVALSAAPVPAVIATDNPELAGSGSVPVETGSQVQGKGGGMGKSYQKNVPGPGSGYPESRGAAAAGSKASPAPTAGAEPVAGKKTAPEQATEQATEQSREQSTEQQPLSRKARDGSGYGSGYPGERGMGVEGSPHHRQYGSQKPATAAPAAGVKP
jgi:hypothetical protein